VTQIRDIGIALENVGQPNQLLGLERRLAYLEDCGYKLVELELDPFHLILDGKLHQPSLADWLSVLRRFDLRYSIHGLERPNLAYLPNHEMCVRIMRCQIEICRAVGASTLVYHSGLEALDDLHHALRRAPLSQAELEEGAQREVRALKELAPIAADAGVVIAVENGDPHLWEYQTLAHHGIPRSDLARYHARLEIEPIVHQLEAVDHPNVGMTLDVAHLYIAAHELGFDYLDAVTTAALWVRHLHVSDNFGCLDRGYDAETDRWAFGEGDMHMPPGWGSIPLRGVMVQLPEFSGDVILEIKIGFLDQARQALEAMRDIITRAKG